MSLPANELPGTKTPVAPEPVRGAGAAQPPAADPLSRVRRAQALWSAVPVPRRLEVMRRLRRRIAASVLGSRPSAAELTARLGRPDRRETLVAEVLPLVEALKFLERNGEELLAERRLGSRGRPAWLRGVELEVRREPLGVVLVIGPSNYPFFLPGVQAVQALTAGNGVLLKPGRGSTPAARVLAAELAAAGLPAGLLQVLPEEPEAAREAIELGVDKVVLTGSAGTGRAVLADLAPRLTPAVLELSGCDAMFVRADADPARVVEALVFSLRLNGGATCIAPRRVFVHRSRADDLASRLAAAAAEVPTTVVTAETARHAARLAADAVKAGARLVSGSLDPAGREAFAPLILAGVPASAEILRRELFAPVVSLIPVADDDEALALDHRCPYALGATIFGAPRGARRLAERVKAGVVVVNDVIVPTADPRLPFAARAASGFGVTRGAEGLLELTALKAIAVRGGGRSGRRHLEPPHPADEPLLRGLLALAHGDLGTRLRGGLTALEAVFRRRSSAVVEETPSLATSARKEGPERPPNANDLHNGGRGLVRDGSRPRRNAS